MTWRQTESGGLARPGDDRRDPGVADPGVDPAPFGDRGVGHRFVEVLVGDVAAEHEGRPGERRGHRLEVPLGPGHERHRGAGTGEGMGEQRPEAAAGAGDHDSLPRDGAGVREGRRYVDLVDHRFSHVVPTSTIHAR